MTNGMDYFSSLDDEKRRKSERAVTLARLLFLLSCAFFGFVAFQTFGTDGAPHLFLNIGKKAVREAVIAPPKPVAAAPEKATAKTEHTDELAAQLKEHALPQKPEQKEAPASAPSNEAPTAETKEAAPVREAVKENIPAVPAEMPVISTQKNELRENVKSEKETPVHVNGVAEKIVEEDIVVNESANGKIEKKEVLIIEKDVDAPARKAADEPVFDGPVKLPPPDLIQGGLVESLPNFGDIKTEEPQIAPLAVISPLPELTDKDGLPHVYKDKNGTKTPFSAYRRPAPADLPPKVPTVAVLISGIGLRDNTTQAAIDTLHPDVSLSISPYAADLGKVVEKARTAGHETFLDQPMQIGVFPLADPGPLGAVAGLPARENLRRMREVLAKKAAFVGLGGTIGESFSKESKQTDGFVKELLSRRLLYVSGTTDPIGKEPNVLVPDVILDGDFYRAAIRAKLDRARRIALKKGYALVRSSSPPIAILEIQKWMESFKPSGENGEIPPEIVFVPVSYLADIASKGQMK